MQALGQAHRFLTVGRLPHHVEAAVALEQRASQKDDVRLVVDEHHPRQGSVPIPLGSHKPKATPRSLTDQSRGQFGHRPTRAYSRRSADGNVNGPNSKAGTKTSTSPSHCNSRTWASLLRPVMARNTSNGDPATDASASP